MMKVFALLVAISACACGCAGTEPRARSVPPADMILVASVVHTMNPRQPSAQAVAIRGDTIVFVGSAAQADELRGSTTRVVRLAGSILPGFHDSHVHPVTGGIELGQCNLNEADTQEQVFATVQQCAANNPELRWVVGGGWALPLFSKAGPTKTRLDELVPDRPAYLTAADAHSAWVNSKALAIAGVSAATPDPADGRIERDGLGEPTGVLREGAMHLVAKHLPPLRPDDYDAGLRRAMKMANRFGITSVTEANASPEVLAAYRRLERAGELTLRVSAAQSVVPSGGVEQIEEVRQRAAALDGPLLRAGAIKIFVDGVIEAKTAAVLEPYVGTDRRGVANLTYEQLAELVVAADAVGLDVHFHAIGDRAVRWALDAVQAARLRNGTRDRRPTIAHAQLIDPRDIPRFRELGVIANFQPLWAYADRYITELTVPVLGAKRSRWLYPIASVFRSGARVVAGSDWSVSSMNPVDGIQVGVTRRSLAGTTPVFIEQERARLDDLLRAYTSSGAYLHRQEDVTGVIEVGKRADLVVLDRDLLSVPATDIHRARVVMTMLDGRVVYDKRK